MLFQHVRLKRCELTLRTRVQIDFIYTWQHGFHFACAKKYYFFHGCLLLVNMAGSAEGMAIIRKEWQYSRRNSSNTEGMIMIRKAWHKVLFERKKVFFLEWLLPQLDLLPPSYGSHRYSCNKITTTQIQISRQNKNVRHLSIRNFKKQKIWFSDFLNSNMC